MIAKMRECGLAINTIATYVRIFKVFLSWAREEGFISVLDVGLTWGGSSDPESFDWMPTVQKLKFK